VCIYIIKAIFVVFEYWVASEAMNVFNYVFFMCLYTQYIVKKIFWSLILRVDCDSSDLSVEIMENWKLFSIIYCS